MMDFESFSRMNKRRCESPAGFNHRLDSWSLSDWITATLGELGEAANVVKKLNRIRDALRGSKPHDLDPIALRAQLARELADVFIYLDLLIQAAGFDIETIVMDTFDAKSQEIGYSG